MANYVNETALVKAILEWLSWHPNLGFYWRNNQNTAVFDGGIYKKRKGIGHVDGTPDIIGILPGGLFIGIEAKMPTNKLSAQQLDFQTMVNRFNGIYIVVKSVEDLKNAFRDIGTLRNLKSITAALKIVVPVDDSNLD